MEKLKATKITKQNFERSFAKKFKKNNVIDNSKNSKKTKKYDKNCKKNQKISKKTSKIHQIIKNFLIFSKQHLAKIIAITVLFSLSVFLALFLNRGYFLFLNRPKILSIEIFETLLILFLVEIFFFFFYDIHKQFKASECKSDNKKIIQPNIPKNKTGLLAKKPFAKNSSSTNSSSKVFKSILSIFILTIIFFIFFNFAILWPGVICAFFCLFVIFNLLIKSKKPFEWYFLIVVFVTSICLWLSTLFLYLLN